MMPEPDAMLELVALKIVEQVIPVVDDYLKGDLHLLAMTIRAAAERFDVEADVLVREHRAMQAIFDAALAIPALASAAPRGCGEIGSYRLSDLRALNRRELADLSILHEAVETLAEPAPVLHSAIRQYIADRAILHAFNAGPYPSGGLAERQEAAMRRTPADPR